MKEKLYQSYKLVDNVLDEKTESQIKSFLLINSENTNTNIGPTNLCHQHFSELGLNIQCSEVLNKFIFEYFFIINLSNQYVCCVKTSQTLWM